MILRQVYRPSAKNSPNELHELAVSLIETSLGDWAPQYLQLLINANSVPKTYIQATVDYVMKHPVLLAIQKDEFLAAAKQARPDLQLLLLTPQGDIWLERVMGELGKALLVRPLQWLIGGK